MQETSRNVAPLNEERKTILNEQMSDRKEKIFQDFKTFVTGPKPQASPPGLGGVSRMTGKKAYV